MPWVALLLILLPTACFSPTPTDRVGPGSTPRSSPQVVHPLNCTAKPSACGYPDETNVGVPPGTELTPSGSVTLEADGQVLDGLDIVGEVNVVASEGVIRNSRITGGVGAGNADWVVVIRPGVKSLRIENSELRTPEGSAQDIACVLNIGNARPVITRVNIHGCSAGVSTGGGEISDSYIHDMSEISGKSHDVGVASNGGGGLVVRHNTIMNQLGQTAAVAFYQDFEVQRDNLVQDNLLAGGGYCVYGGNGDKGAAKRIRIVNNRLSKKYFPRCGRYGVIAAFDPDGEGNLFEGNYWDDSGDAVLG